MVCAQSEIHEVTVSQAAEVLGVSVDTIRRWNKLGLIKARRSENNHRLFNLEELEKLQRKISGFSSENHYRVLKAERRSKHTCIDLFAGAGGTALGFHNAGLNHIMLVEQDRDAVRTLTQNMPNWEVVQSDIRSVDFRGIRADVVEAGFPCQAFSYAGHKRGFEDARGTLFYEFARAVRDIRPAIAVGENVRGLLAHDGGRTLNTMIRILRELGYRVSYKLLRAQYHDVPQKRERLIILAIREDLQVAALFPKENDYVVSLREALEGCPSSPGFEYTERKRRILELVPPGGYWKDLPDALQREYMGRSYYLGGGKTGMARRLSWDEPSLTLTCNPAQKQTERCHPEETRPLSVREYARIQTFPDEWQFSGSVASQYRQIGNAVPVNLGYHIGRCVVAMLEGRSEDDTMVAEPFFEPLQMLF
ncbi:MAG: DNA (cytosine-5-)-methyltransferase [Coriobacteriia bacterium]|nr:DNA (cytosine-5-)-methyltransferase [Coriobacteriia bacterium]